MVGKQFNLGDGFGGNPDEPGGLIARELGGIRSTFGEALRVIVLEPAQVISKLR